MENKKVIQILENILAELNELNKSIETTEEIEQSKEYKIGWEVGFAMAKMMFFQKPKRN